MNIFYVYIYLDPRKHGSFDYGEFHFDFEPFYVGKGVGTRDFSHIVESSKSKINSYKLNKIRKIQSLGLEPKIIKYKENLIEEVAFDLEKKLVNAIGRSDLGLGPLTNLTDGGDGLSGVIHSKESILRQAKKLSIYRTGRTAEIDPGVAKTAEALRGRKRGTKEDTPWIARAAKKKTGRTKETHSYLASVAEKNRIRNTGRKKNER